MAMFIVQRIRLFPQYKSVMFIRVAKLSKVFFLSFIA